MKSRRFSFVVGMLVGAVLFSGATAYAAGIMAEHAPQTAYVDGKPVQLEAYNIGGHNYVKIRDIGQAVGFNVYWDGKSVQMDTNAPYTGTGPVQVHPAAAKAGGIEVGSFKGSTLTAGELGALIVYPYDPDDTAVSSNPSVLGLRYVLGHWTAEAKSPGTATITIKAADGRSGSVTINVVPAADPTPASPSAVPSGQSGIDLNANMEIRQEMIRLTNQVRRENGLPELPVNDALMNAAQEISSRKYTKHHGKEECETISAYGYPYGTGTNLTVFSSAAPQYIAQTAVANWVSSPGHLQTILQSDRDCIGVGVTIEGGRAYCQMYVGSSQAHNPYGKN